MRKRLVRKAFDMILGISLSENREVCLCLICISLFLEGVTFLWCIHASLFSAVFPSQNCLNILSRFVHAWLDGTTFDIHQSIPLLISFILMVNCILLCFYDLTSFNEFQNHLVQLLMTHLWSWMEEGHLSLFFVPLMKLFDVYHRIMRSSGRTLANTWNWVVLKIVKITSALLPCLDFSLPKVKMRWSAWMSIFRIWSQNKRISITLLLTVWQVLRTHPSWRNFLRRILKYVLVFSLTYI